MLPIKTCKPWNPVATKKLDPYAPSAIVKVASLYSLPWRKEKYTPRITVLAKPWIPFGRSPSISLWCAQVTVTPEASKTPVFNKGISKGFKGTIPEGGQQEPNSKLGANLLWKYAQKKAKKKQISDTINKIMPQRNPFDTCIVWNPWNVASRIISRHHWIIVNPTKIKPKIIVKIE